MIAKTWLFCCDTVAYILYYVLENDFMFLFFIWPVFLFILLCRAGIVLNLLLNSEQKNEPPVFMKLFL